jgi:phosphoglycolate phosphatase
MRHHLIFDLDGTLVDSCAICCEIVGTMLAARGSRQRIDAIAARSWMSIGGAKMIAALLGDDCGDPAAEIAEFRRIYAEKQTRPETLFPHVASGLARLRAAGHSLSICSNKPQNLVDKVLADTGIAPLFASVVGQRPDLRPKPAPDMLDTVLAELGASCQECLFIGDSELDHQVAENAGMGFLFVTYGYAHADYVAPQDSFDCFGALTERLLTPLLSNADA